MSDDPKIIYVLTKGDYSDYRIQAISFDREELEKFIRFRTGQDETGKEGDPVNFGDFQIEEWELGVGSKEYEEQRVWMVSGPISEDTPQHVYPIFMLETDFEMVTPARPDWPAWVQVQRKDREQALRRWAQIRREMLAGISAEAISPEEG